MGDIVLRMLIKIGKPTVKGSYPRVLLPRDIVDRLNITSEDVGKKVFITLYKDNTLTFEKDGR